MEEAQRVCRVSSEVRAGIGGLSCESWLSALLEDE